MRGRTRFLQKITSDTPPGSTALTDENWDACADGDIPDVDNTTADASTGAGSLTASAEWSMEGPVSAKVSGVNEDWREFNTDADGNPYPAHADHFLSTYFKLTGAPGATAWLFEVRDGTDTNAAGRIGITPDVTLIVSDGF